MVGNQMAGESITSNLAGMSKNQLYDIMSQMKTLIEQNQQQARQILIDNPALTKALFQAQIMLGMVQPPKVMPNIQQTLSQSSQQATPAQQLNVQSHPMPVQVGLQEPASASQPQIQARKQQENQPLLPIPSTSISQVSLQSQAMPSHPLQSMQQPKGHPNAQGPSMSLPPTQIHGVPPLSHHSAPQPPSLLQSQMPIVSAQLQQPMHSSGPQHMPLQPPLPLQPRPPAMQPSFQHHMGPHMGFQTSGAPQPHLSQPPFNSGKPPGSVGSSFPPQVQTPLLNQPMPQSMYPVGGPPHLPSEFNSHPGSSMQVDRPSWMPGLPSCFWWKPASRATTTARSDGCSQSANSPSTVDTRDGEAATSASNEPHARTGQSPASRPKKSSSSTTADASLILRFCGITHGDNLTQI